MGRRPQGKSKEIYFTQETEDAIVLYNNSSDFDFRNKIFREKIYNALYKLSENIIHTFKFYYTDVNDIEDLKLEVVSMLVEEKLYRFDPSKGAKAYSYFGTIVKRWLINYNVKNYKKLKQSTQFSDIEESYEEEEITEKGRVIKLAALVDTYVDLMYEQSDKLFNKPQEREVVDAILVLFKARKDISVFKKKALYIYIREMTDCETPTLTKVIGVLKEEFRLLTEKYLQAGYEIKY
jgi:hypothetical protein